MVRTRRNFSLKQRAGKPAGLQGGAGSKGPDTAITEPPPDRRYSSPCTCGNGCRSTGGGDPRCDRSPLLSAGRAPKARKPKCGRMGRRGRGTTSRAPDQSCLSRRNAWTFSGGRLKATFDHPNAYPGQITAQSAPTKLCTEIIVFNVLFLKASTAITDFWGGAGYRVLDHRPSAYDLAPE